LSLKIVQLGSPRAENEGLRIGTVRRLPRGVPKAEYASRDYFDVWLPNLSPSAELVAQARAGKTEKEWAAFTRAFRAEMKRPEPAKILDLLAALSHTTQLSVGCYCDEESRCHRSVLRELLDERGADIS
jgi:uncharacterized protein YeaO (DUF488 family)